MNESRGGQIIALLMSLCLAVYAVFAVMLTQGNSISEMCQILMVGGVLLCFISPKSALVVWIISSGYMDLIKRLTVLSGKVSQMDLYYILGIHPLMLCGLCASIFIGALLGRQRLTKGDMKRFIAALFVMILVALMAAREKGLHPSAILSDVANNGLYSMLLFVVPIMLPTLQSILKILRIIVIAYFPVAIYGIVQQAWGFQDFEVEYLLTGLSIEVKQLVANEVRAFSTLNSPTALSFVSAMCLTITWILGWQHVASITRCRLPKIIAFILIVVYFGALLSSTVRSAIVLVPVAVAGMLLFHHARRLRLFYASLVVGFVGIVLGAEWLLLKLPDAMNKMAELAGDSQFAGQILRVGTYTERLVGFSQVLGNPRAYSLFGFGSQRGGLDDPEFYNHDPLSTLLVRYGVLALLALLVGGALVVRYYHACVWRIKDPMAQRASALILSIPLGFLVASLMQGSVFGTFPLNLFSFLCFGMVESISVQAMKESVPEAPRGHPALGMTSRISGSPHRFGRPQQIVPLPESSRNQFLSQ